MLITALIWFSCFILYIFIGCIHYIVWDKLFILNGSANDYSDDLALLLAVSWIISTPFAIVISFTAVIVRAMYNVLVGMTKVVK